MIAMIAIAAWGLLATILSRLLNFDRQFMEMPNVYDIFTGKKIRR